MANPGAFDADLRQLTEFDPTVLALGWYEYGLPFDHALIPSASSGTDYFDTLTLGRTLGYSVLALLDALGASTYSLTRALTGADSLDMSAAVSATRAAGYSNSGADSMLDTLSITRVLGAATAASMDGVGSLALARTLALAGAAGLDAVAALALARLEALAGADVLDAVSAVGLGRLDSLNGTGGLDALSAASLNRALSLSDLGVLDLLGALALSETRGLAGAGGLDMLAVLALAETLGFAAALVIAILLKQTAFRFYNDDGSESAETPVAGENVNASIALGTNIIIRIQVDSRGEPLASQFQLEYRRSGSSDPWQVVS